MQQEKNIREQERERVRQLIRSRFGTELAACGDLDVVISEVVARRDPQMSAPVGTAAGPAVMFLFGKIWRSFSAIRILAQEGYGPDAMVLARSLTRIIREVASHLGTAPSPWPSPAPGRGNQELGPSPSMGEGAGEGGIRDS